MEMEEDLDEIKDFEEEERKESEKQIEEKEDYNRETLTEDQFDKMM